MVKVAAPALSLEASGKLGGAIVYSKWKGRPYARRLVKPANPQTAAQTGIRAMMKFLAQVWADLGIEAEQGFVDLAAATNISVFNAYIAYNVRRWREFKGPAQQCPALETATSLTVTQALTGGQRNMVIGLTPSAATDLWGFMLLRDTANITTPNWNKCIAVLNANGTNQVLFTDAPLAAGTYHYRAACFNNSGKIAAWCTDASAAVT